MFIVVFTSLWPKRSCTSFKLAPASNNNEQWVWRKPDYERAIEYLEKAKIKNYTKNDANAEKCWGWFFDNLDFNNSDYLAGSHINDFLYHFLVNNEVSSVYKNKIDLIATPYITKCRYDQYEYAYDPSFDDYEDDDVYQYLLSKFEKFQLDREVNIKWIPNKHPHDEEGTDFDVLIEIGLLKDEDIISFNGYGGAYRIIKSLWKDGIEVSILNEGEIGIIKVTSILDDFDGFLSDNLSIKVLGNDTLEEKTKEVVSRELAEKPEVSVSQPDTMQVNTGKGLVGKMKSWFNWGERFCLPLSFAYILRLVLLYCKYESNLENLK